MPNRVVNRIIEEDIGDCEGSSSGVACAGFPVSAVALWAALQVHLPSPGQSAAAAFSGSVDVNGM